MDKVQAASTIKREEKSSREKKNIKITAKVPVEQAKNILFNKSKIFLVGRMENNPAKAKMKIHSPAIG